MICKKLEPITIKELSVEFEIAFLQETWISLVEFAIIVYEVTDLMRCLLISFGKLF